MRERNRLAGAVEGVRKLERDVADAVELIALAESDNDAAMAAEASASLRVQLGETALRDVPVKDASSAARRTA